jgi:imidazolonepropionase-like amidohydrolase
MSRGGRAAGRRVRGTSLLVLLGMLLSVAAAGAQAAADTARTLAFTHATVFDGTGRALLRDMTILINGERIAALFASGSRPLPARAVEIDLTGRYVIPGLIDTHVHVATSVATEDARPRTERRLRFALLGGVTAAREMAGDVRALGSLARDARVGLIASPDLYYSALWAGPAFFTDPRTQAAAEGAVAGTLPWMLAVTDTTNLPEAVAMARGTGATAIKLYAALDSGLTRRIVAEAHRQGFLVWAHAALRPAMPVEVVSAGVDAVSHAHLLLDGLTRDRRKALLDRARSGQPVVLDDPQLDTLFRAMVAHRTAFEPTLFIYQDDPGALRLTGAVTRRAHDAGVTILAGTDSIGTADGEGLPLPNIHRELELLVTEGGLSAAEALEAATRNAAAAMGIGGIRGTIEAGRLADLVILRADPLADIRFTRAVDRVVKRGQVVIRRAP